MIDPRKAVFSAALDNLKPLQYICVCVHVYWGKIKGKGKEHFFEDFVFCVMMVNYEQLKRELQGHCFYLFIKLGSSFCIFVNVFMW